MEKTNFLITDAAKQVHVLNHVLRYWEEELGLEIKRNELGHRYYSQEDIQQFIEIKRLKDQGIQLKAIKNMMLEESESQEHPENAQNGLISTRMEQMVGTMPYAENNKIMRLQELLRQLIGDTVRENTKVVYEEMRDQILKEIDYQFRTQEEQEEKREEERMKREEEHYKNIDELLRNKTNKNQRKKHSIF